MAPKQKPSLSTFSFNSLLAGVLVVLCLLLLEAVFRYYNFGKEALLHTLTYNPVALLRTDFVEPVTNQGVGWRLRPNMSGTFKGGQFSTNEHGLRSPPVSRAKPEGKLRIVVLGSSVSMGSGVADHEVYSRRLNELLDRSYPGRFQVINFSVGGYEFNQIDASYDDFVKPFSPDIILLPMTIRGFLEPTKTTQWPLSFAIPGGVEIRPYFEYFFLYPAIQKWFSKFFRKNLSNDWRKLGPVNRNSLFSTFKSEYESTTRLVQDFIVKRNAENVPVVVTLMKSPWDVPQPFRKVASYLVKNSLDEVDGDLLIDTNDSITTELTSKDTIYYGDNHPNARVHGIFAQAIYRDLLPLLKNAFEF